MTTFACIAFDRVAVSTREPDGHGGLFATGTIARSGPQRYRVQDIKTLDGQSAFPDRGANDIVLVDRPVEEVRKSAKKFEHKAITVGHPDRNTYPHGVTADNYAALANGYTYDCKAQDTQDGGCVVQSRMHFTTRRAVQALDDGQDQLSAGYGHKLVVGQCKSYDGTVCDARMEDIEPNHSATVDFARGGPGCRVHDETQSEDTMSKLALTVDGVTLQTEDAQMHGLCTKLQTERDEARTKLAAAEASHATAIKDMATAHDAALQAERAKIPTPEAFKARVKLHAAALSLASGLLAKDAKAEDMDTEQLQRAVITAAGEKHPTIKTATTAVLAGTTLDKASDDLLSRAYGIVAALLPTAGTKGQPSRAQDEATARALAGSGAATEHQEVNIKDVPDLTDRGLRK